ncbi:MAG TPA: hypothetical protein VFG42_22030 [Baekduia sp.]|uniref:hypothetical protein n=1 Tax=Baekduia sp. TaxID=2600305 RepID=UPI002D76CDEE|nr:hypothetical protein [Baekduia sp.]HET6509493.1 hypothetical protein [Baekduia sp.]
MGTPVSEDAPAARPLLPRWLQLPIAVLVVVFLVLAVASQWSKVADADLRFEPLWLVAAIPPLALYQLLQAEIALAVLRRLGHPIKPSRGRTIYGFALLARYVPTGALVFALRITMNEREGVPKKASSVALVYEIALSLAGASVAAIPLLPQVEAALLIAAVLPVAGVALLHPAPFARLTSRLLRRVGREPLDQVLPFRAVVVLVLANAVTFSLAGVSLLFTLQAITPVDAGDMVGVVAAFGLGFITGMVGFALPGGLGARELGLVTGLSAVIAAPIALAVAGIARLLQTGVELLYAGIVTAHDRAERRRTEKAAVTRSG